VSELKQDLSFNAIAEGHKHGGKSQRDTGKNDQRERDQPLLYQPPALGQLVAAAKTFHPGDHDARSGPQCDQRSGDEYAHRALRRATQIGQRGGGPGRKNLAYGVGNLSQIGLSLAGSREHGADEKQCGKKREDGRISRGFGGGKRVVLKRAPEGEAKQAQETRHEWPQSSAPGDRMQLRSAATFLILQSFWVSVHWGTP